MSWSWLGRGLTGRVSALWDHLQDVKVYEFMHDDCTSGPCAGQLNI